jgi:hypothetical protein
MSNIDIINTVIADIYEKYKDDKYIMEKMENYINELPDFLQKCKDKKSRMNELVLEQDAFVRNFLNTNLYFYVSTTDKYVYYDNTHYTAISEDDLLYEILTSITKQNSELSTWKQRTKINIIKKIKERSLVQYTPNSKTIQFVLNLLSPLFTSKNRVKYLLTLMGDSILRKNETQNHHFMDAKSKNFVRELNNLCYFYLGSNMNNTIKYKYHDAHDFSQCRFIQVNENIKNETLWNLCFQHSIDIFCVASHYSLRYKSSDNYLLNHSNDGELIETTMYLRDKTPQQLTDIFIREYISILPEDVANVNEGISWKNMLYLWRIFLESKGLPNVLFQDSFKQILTTHDSVNPPDLQHTKYVNGVFMGMTSKYLPLVRSFIDFWNDNITINTTDANSELEIEEIRLLFNGECGYKTGITEKMIIDILTHFFPNVEICSDKFIYGISCRLWDKEMDIEIAMKSLKNIDNLNFENINIEEKYLYYCKYYSNEENKLVVGKSFFETSEPSITERLLHQNF